jgi:hypothetical protein
MTISLSYGYPSAIAKGNEGYSFAARRSLRRGVEQLAYTRLRAGRKEKGQEEKERYRTLH